MEAVVPKCFPALWVSMFLIAVGCEMNWMKLQDDSSFGPGF